MLKRVSFHLISRPPFWVFLRESVCVCVPAHVGGWVGVLRLFAHACLPVFDQVVKVLVVPRWCCGSNRGEMFEEPLALARLY